MHARTDPSNVVCDSCLMSHELVSAFSRFEILLVVNMTMVSRDGQWTCDCDAVDASGTLGNCPHVYAALLSSATHRVELEESSEVAEERPIRCRYCGSPDISKVGFRYNARGISRRYLCNECRRKFSVAYVEPQAVVGLPSGALWLLSQIAMITAKLNDLLRDLDERIASEQTDNKLPQAGSDSSIRT